MIMKRFRWRNLALLILFFTVCGARELSHYDIDSFIEWPAGAPSENVPTPPMAAEIYAKIMVKTRVFQFLIGLNLDFEFEQVDLLDRTPFPTLEEAYTYCLFD
ncbi:hypothetical protein GIB67_006930 [Kingdonia uniflora]|uniref:Uncharacterized protein n=1 Tax=Kingdonia uniflora TaxID=39325 RepID=A0A7J7L0C9_9MAGN|nr:hypothetical protein GIB67_006930 [Kingdonia uniflora]